MATETAQKIVTPGFTYKGIDVPGLEISTDLIDNLGTNKPAYELALKSAPLAWKVGLYMVGRDLALGEEDAEALPEPVREAGRMVYEDCQARKGMGVWHKDAVLFEPGATIRGSVRPGNDYIAARYFIDIEGFDNESGEPSLLPSTREERIWVPKGDEWFIVPTPYGMFHPITGTPLETIESKEEAIRRLKDAGLTENELSRHHRGSSGIYTVLSWSNDYYGPLCVNLYFGPRNCNSDFGSLAVGRSAEQSEAPKNRGFRMLTEAEYNALVENKRIVVNMRELLK